MARKKSVLWVEDSARFELATLFGPIYASREFDLTLAENTTEAVDYLRGRKFDAIIVDVRLPPGRHEYWRALYRSAGSDRTNAKLGLKLLSWLLQGTDRRANGAMPEPPSWHVAPEQIGVFSVESHIEIGASLNSMGVGVMHEKRPGLPDTILLDIVNQVLSQSEPSETT